MKKILFFLTLFLLSAGMSFAQNEAKIGTTEYPTLEEAIAAATSGDVVEIIVANCGITNTTVIPAGITIKGQGKTATTMLIESTSGSGLTINNANVTLKDMTIDGTQVTSGGYKTLVNVRADGVLIDNVIMKKGGTSTWNSSILVETLNDTQTFTVSNSTISGSFRGVLRESCSANIVINNCDIDAVYPFNIDGGSGGTVTVTGGALHGWTSYSGVDQVTFTNVTFSKANSGYDCVASYVNTTFNECTMDANFDIYAQTSGFGFTLTDCEKNGVLVTNLNFTELFPANPAVWNNCVTTVNQVILVGSKAQMDAAAASGPATVYTQMTQNFAYDGNLNPAITSLYVKGGDNGDSTITFTNCTATNGVLSVTGDLASFTCGGATINFENVAVLLGENASFTVDGQTNFFKAVPLYQVNEANNGDGTYTYTTEYIGVAKIGTTPYATLDAAAAAVPVGTPTTITILQNLNFYDITGSNLTDKTITFTGTATDTLTLTNTAHAQTAAYGADLTFESITLKNDNTTDVYRGIIHANKVTINDCEILGFMMGYAENFICNYCTFTKTDKYHMWTYGSNCTFNNCTFNSYNNGNCKAINVYWDSPTTYRVIAFNDCAFNSDPAVTTETNSAIQINSGVVNSKTPCFVVYINNCTVNGYINNSSTVTGYANLVNNKSGSVGTTLYIDGVQILKQGSCDPVAKIGDTYYQTLQAALDAAHEMTGDVTIEILRNFEEDATILQKAGLNYTIEGNNDTLNGRIFVDGDRIFPNPVGEVTITNLNFTYNTSLTYGDATKGFICNSTNNLSYAAHVTVSNCTFDGGATGISGGMCAYRDPSGAQSWDITLDHLVAKNCHSLVQAVSVSGMVITNCTATDNVKNGINISGGGSNHIPGVTNVYTIANDTLTCNADGEYSIRIQEMTNTTDTFILADNLFTAPKAIISKHNTTGVIGATSGLYKGKISIENTDAATFAFTGGTFTNLGGADDEADSNNVKSKCATGYGCYKNVDTYPAGWTVLKMYWVTYDANGGDGSMEPSYVAPFPNSSFTTKNNEFTWTTTFTNWNTKADGTGDTYAEGDPMVISSDTTLYAQWNIVATVGGKAFSSLQAAVDYANDNLTGDVTIDLVQNTSEIVKILQKDGISITINGNDSTLTGQIFISNRQETPAYVGDHTAPNTVTIDNLNMKYDPTYYDDNGSADESGLIYFCKNCAFGNVLNYSHNVTISNCDFDADGSNKSIYAISSIAGTVYNLDIINCTAKNALGLATLQSAPEFEVTGCKTEDVTYGIRIVNNYGPMTVNNNNFTADEAGFYVTGMTTGAVINFAEDTVNAAKAFKLDPSCTSGTLDITSGLYIGEVDDNASSDFFNISGGTYSKDVSGEPCAPGYAAFANGTNPETWTVTKAWFLYYDKNEAGASGTMDTLFVKQSGTEAERTLVVDNCNFTWLPDHSFLAWNTKANALGDTLRPGDNIILSSDTTLYVIWQEGYTIFYDNNGGVGTIPNQYKAVDETITLSDGTDGAGNYLFTKTDSTLYRWNTAAGESGDNYALGAEYSANSNVTMYAVWRLNLDMTMDSTDVVCYGENNGTDTVKIIGGEAPYMLVLSSSVLPQNDTVKNIMDTKYVFENLKPGSYNVELSDVLKKDFITGHFTIAQPDTLIVETMTVPVKPCPLMGTGVYNVSMTTTGGNGDNHFVWSDAAVNVDAMATTVIPGADDRDSTYTVTVTVTDKKGCTATRTETFSLSPVIADDGTVHANSKLTTNPDTIKVGIYQGCDTIIRDFGTYVFTSTNPAIDVNILDTVYNDVDVNYPDSTFPVGYSTITWTAVDTCGHSITGEQVVYIYHFPCPDVDLDGYTYHSVRLGCNCWTNENLRAEKYSDGRAIPNVMTYVSDLHPDATANANTYGHLYDWYAAVDTETNSIADIEANYALGKHIQGICPDGWYLPNDEDFNDFDAYETKDLRSTDNWLISGGEGPGTNATGFNAEPSGFYDCATGRFEDLGTSSFYWSCHPVLDMATGAMIAYVCERLQKPKQMPRCNGLSVRCVLIYE